MISTAIEKGSFVYVYDDKNYQCACISKGSDGELMGFTLTTVSVRKGHFVYVYDEKGHQKSCHSV